MTLSDRYYEGFLAGEEETPISDNPYTDNAEASVEWLMGWNDGYLESGPTSAESDKKYHRNSADAYDDAQYDV